MSDDRAVVGGNSPLARIDGDKIRRLRESKGLTQLYVATAVGVTTETISRWENRRYPAIKMENAQRVAETLEAALDDILDHEEASEEEALSETPDEEPLAAAAPSPDADELAGEQQRPAGIGTSPSLPRWMLPGLLLVLLAAATLWWLMPAGESVTVVATRSLPAHAPAGEPFPVVITVKADQSGPFPLILTESLPEGCEAIEGEPKFTTFDPETGVLKWISQIDGEAIRFFYLARASKQQEAGAIQRFSGSVTLRQQDQPTTAIGGDDSLTISNYHWADTNADGRIDDEEILTVYDQFSDVAGLDFGKDLIEAIWAAKGYRWDGATSRYEILQ